MFRQIPNSKPCLPAGRFQIPNSFSDCFTFIELLISLAIIGILAVMMFSAYSGLRPHNDVDADARNIVSIFNLARSRTLASQNASQFGVHMQTDGVVLFQGNTYNVKDPLNQKFALSSRDAISTIAFAGNAVDVVFNKISGTASVSGTLVVGSLQTPSESETIYVQSSGEVGTTLPPTAGTAGRVSDARHVNFVLGWSIQNATVLELYFPASNITEDIPMNSYFNADKTLFDTTQTFVIDGTNQTLRLHTLSLDANNTTLSIHRDRNGGLNNAAVDVRIVDAGLTKAIASYNAGSSVQVGTYGGAMTIQ